MARPEHRHAGPAKGGELGVVGGVGDERAGPPRAGELGGHIGKGGRPGGDDDVGRGDLLAARHLDPEVARAPADRLHRGLFELGDQVRLVPLSIGDELGDGDRPLAAPLVIGGDPPLGAEVGDGEPRARGTNARVERGGLQEHPARHVGGPAPHGGAQHPDRTVAVEQVAGRAEAIGAGPHDQRVEVARARHGAHAGRRGPGATSGPRAARHRRG